MNDTEYTVSELMCTCIAREIDEGDVVILGSFTPLAYAAYILAKMTHAPNLFLVAYSGVDTRPFPISFFTAEGAAIKGAAALWTFTECINSLHLASRADVEAVSSVQLDNQGAINICVIGEDYWHPRVRLPGGAGASDVIKMHRKMIGYFPAHTERTFVPKVDFVTGTRHLVSKEERERAGLRWGPCRFVTNLCVMEMVEKGQPFLVRSLHPGVTPEVVVENTGFPVDIPADTPLTEPPSAEQLRLLREVIDPLGTREFDFKPGKERLAYLEEVLRREWALVD